MDIRKLPVLFGAGGAGCNLVKRVSKGVDHGFELFAANADRKSLLKNPASNRILLGENICKGLGCGGLSIIGRESALESQEVLRRAVKGRSMVVVVAGMGGGCGAGAAPEVVRLAQEEGAEHVFALAAMPYSFEGLLRRRNAKESLAHLRSVTDLVFEVNGWRLRSQKRDWIREFERFDLRLWGVASALRDLFATQYVVDLDLAGLKKALVSCRGGRLGHGEAAGSGRVRIAWMKAMRPLVEGIPMGKAKHIWLHLVGARGVTLSEMSEAVRLAVAVRPEGAELHVSCSKDPDVGQRVRMTVVAV